jgi:protein-tyrosine phosphatase
MIGRLKGWLQGGAAPAGQGAATAEAAELRVLMVCTGNICRSPTAEGVLRDRLVRAGLAGRVVVDSAGTQGYHTGEGPDPRAVKAAAARGYDLRGLRARPMSPADFAQFDLLLAMDEDHLAWMQRKAPAGTRARMELLMPHSRRFGGERNVPDPYYGAPAGFDRVLDLVEDACDGLLAHLLAQLQGRQQDHPPGGVRGQGRLKNPP